MDSKVTVFDIDIFIKIMSKKKKTIETKDISEWLNIGLRNLQKFASKYDIPYTRSHGRKYYIWDNMSLVAVKLWFEDKYIEKPKKSYYIPKPLRTKKEKIAKRPKPTYITTREIVIEYYRQYSGYTYKEIMRRLQRWCKKNNIPKDNRFGREYYMITGETKKQIIKELSFPKPFKIANEQIL